MDRNHIATGSKEALLGFAARWLNVLRSMKFQEDLKYLYDKGEQKDTMTTNANLADLFGK